MNTLQQLTQLKRKYLKAKEAYYAGGDPIMTDVEFDAVEDRLQAIDPSWSELKKTGVKVGKKVEVALHHPMPSLNKAYPADLPKWFSKNPAAEYVVMAKLDGSSVQLTYEDGVPTQLVTRGDGTHGKDISFLLPYLPRVPKKIKAKGRVVLRCEAVMAKRVFDKKWASRFENSRNLVNGLLNRQDVHPALKDVDIVVLGVYDTDILSGMARADKHGFMTVSRSVVAANEVDPALLQQLRAAGEYDMDGLVVAPTTFTLAYTSSDKPKGIIAFKVNADEEAAEVTVKRVIWQVTGNARIVPKIEITPTRMDGVTVTHATAHNAKWMNDRGIGPGAVVRVLRSGGVIPKIVSVTRRAKQLSVPDIPHKTLGVHYVAVDADKSTSAKIDQLRVVKFMKTLGVELIAGKTASVLASGGLRTPEDYLRAWGDGTLRDVIDAAYPGRQGAKLYGEISTVFRAPIPVARLMVASQVFGVGIGMRKLASVEAAGVKLSFTPKTVERLAEVEGFSDKTVNVVKKGLADWARFLDLAESSNLRVSYTSRKKVVQQGPLTGAKVSFTGYRDKAQEEWVTSNGGEVVPFGGKTTILLYKDGGKASAKVAAATARGISVRTFNELMK